MFYFLSLSAGLIVGYFLSKRKGITTNTTTNSQSSSSTSSQDSTTLSTSENRVKFIGKRSAVVDIGKGVKLFVPVSIIDSKFSGRLRLSLEKRNVDNSLGISTTTWLPINSKISEYPISEKEICVFPPFTIQNKIFSCLAVELVDFNDCGGKAEDVKVLERYVVTDAQRSVNLFPLGWWHISVEEVIKNYK